MQTEDLVHLLVRSRRFILLVIISAMVSALMLTYVISEKYQSSTVVLVQPQKSLDLVPKRAEILNFPVGFNTPTETGSMTYSELVKSRAVAEKIVVSLQLDRVDKREEGGILGSWRRAITGFKKTCMKAWTLLKFGRIPNETPFNEAVEETVASLYVKPTKDTYLFEIVARARSPKRAADIANCAAAAFSEYIEQVSAADNATTSKQSDEKLKLSEEKLNSSRRALAEYKREHGIASLKKQTELEVEALSGLESSLQNILTKSAGHSARRTELRQKIGETARITRSSSKIIDNPLLRELRTKLTTNGMKLARLNELYTEKHKEVDEITAENAQITEALKYVSPTLDSEQVMQVNPLYQGLVADLSTVEADLVSLNAEREKLTSAIDAKKAAIARMPSEEATLARLQLAVDIEEDTHKIIARENEELRAAATKGRPIIEVVHAAVPSEYPVSPIKVYNVALAAALATLAAIAMVIAGEQLAPLRADAGGEAKPADVPTV